MCINNPRSASFVAHLLTGLLCFTALSGCSESPEVNDEAANTSQTEPEVVASISPPPFSETPTPIADLLPVLAWEQPQNQASAIRFNWTTPVGGGELSVKKATSRDFIDESSATGITTLTGVHFPESDPTGIVFLGTQESGYPTLIREELLDALAVALSSLKQGELPGVSIDPASEQLSREIREDDLMTVRYPGTGRNTELGWISFEADRVMKCLSLGKDNLTKQPFLCTVPGYLNELQRMSQLPGSPQSWHRFWIEPSENTLSVSRNGRTVLISNKVAVHTRYMKVSGGQLVDAQQPADPAARDFAVHLTENYDAYAKQFPVFHKLRAFSVITSVAQAILGLPRNQQDPPRSVKLQFNDVEFLRQHVPATRETPQTTPATISVLEVRQETGTLSLKMMGGVDLGAKVEVTNFQIDDPKTDRVDDLVAGVFQAPNTSNPSTKSVFIDGTEYRALPTGYGTLFQGWQQDVEVGAIKVVRELVPGIRSAEFGEHWRLRLPRIHLSTYLAQFGNEQVPRDVLFENFPQPAVVLNQYGTQILPFEQGEFRTYFDSSEQVKLITGSDVWRLITGEVTYSKDENGVITTHLGGQTRQFDFTAKTHRIVNAKSAETNLTFEYDGDQLKAIHDPQGNRIQIQYDKLNRITGLKTSDGRSLAYRYDRTDRLAGMFRETGENVAYAYHETSGLPYASTLESTSVTTPTFEYSTHFLHRALPFPHPAIPQASGSRLGASVPDSRKVVIQLKPSTDPERDLEITFNDNPVEFYGKLKGALEIALSTGPRQAEQIKALNEIFGSFPEITRGDARVVEGSDKETVSLLGRFLERHWPARSEIRLPEVGVFQIRSTANDQGTSRLTFDVEFNGNLVPLDVPWDDLLYSAEGPRHEAARQRLQNALRPVLGEKLEGIVLIEAAQANAWNLRDRFARVLQSLHPDCTAYTTTDTELARRKLSEEQTRSWEPARILLVDETLDQQSIAPALREHVQTLPGNEESPFVVVVGHNGHNDQRLFERLQAEGDAGRLRGKTVIFETCFSDSLRLYVEQILSKSKAREAVYFAQPISQKVLSPLLEALQERLLEASRETTTVHRPAFFRSVMERVIKGVRDGRWERRNSDEPRPNFSSPPRESDVTNLLQFNLQAKFKSLSASRLLLANA